MRIKKIDKSKIKKPSYFIKSVFSDVPEDGITMLQVEENIKEFGFYFFIFLFSLITTLPIPIPPGMHWIAAMPIFIVAFQHLINRPYVRFPDFIAKKTLNQSFCVRIVEMTEKYVVPFESKIKHRFALFASSRFKIFNMCFVILNAVSIIIPLPLTNWIPSISISFISFGLIAVDGLIVLIGYITGIAGLFVAGGSVYAFMKAITFTFKHVVG